MGKLTFYLGGAKSGKTALAQKYAETFPPPRIYLATAEALDEEMAVRISRHQQERGVGWQTVEAPLDPAAAIESLSGDGVIMFDCVTLWLSNLLGQGDDAEAALQKVHKLLIAISRYPGPVVVVSNELGGGIVPMNPLARSFRDLAGAANQMIAAAADQAYLAVAGLPLKLK